VHEGVAAGVLAHHQRGLLHADGLRRHDLVGLGVLEHAVLVDAGLVGEGVAADDRLVELHRERVAAETSFEARVSMVVSILVQNGNTSLRTLHRHHDLFERGVAGPLADAVDGAFDLPRAAVHAGSEFATAMPRSLWQCTEKRAWSEFGTRSRSLA
jgi:hypothetical protein